MISLSNLQDESRPYKRRKRVGRGPGSGLGKTCGRGEKGAGSRSGYKRRLTYEGGQFRTFMKIPQRGFSNVRFQRKCDVVNLGQINEMFEDGDIVDLEALRSKGFVGPAYGLKVLGDGELTKKVSIHADHYSKSALLKIKQAKLSCKIVQRDGSLVDIGAEE